MWHSLQFNLYFSTFIFYIMKYAITFYSYKKFEHLFLQEILIFKEEVHLNLKPEQVVLTIILL